jgi:hypothetical protein
VSYLDRIGELAQAWLDRNLVKGSLVIQSAEVLTVTDDEDPEGGAVISARLTLGGDFSDWSEPPDLVKWATDHIPGRLQMWATREGRNEQVLVENDKTLLLTFAYIPDIDRPEFIALAKKVAPYVDPVIDIDFSRDYLEVTRVSNKNPTTMVKNFGDGECIRHHGEHLYINKHLLKVALGA